MLSVKAASEDSALYQELTADSSTSVQPAVI